MQKKSFEPEIVLISAGEFLMGSNPKTDSLTRDYECPQHTLYLPSYYIAKTPVTNYQYLAFVHATSHSPPKNWTDGEIPPGKEIHPVTHVSWYDALEYCHWLSEFTGKSYSLPNEAEWEKGARGNDGRIYPWGNQWDERHCNTEEGGRENTTPVGLFRHQVDNPYGLLDMAGNVWEWTICVWGKSRPKPEFGYPYHSSDGRENLQIGNDTRRVVRGESFIQDKCYARCAARRGGPPNVFYRSFGFRVIIPLNREKQREVT